MAALHTGVQPATSTLSDNDDQFARIMKAIKAMPTTNQTFETAMRVWQRVGLMPAKDATDAGLLAAWEQWKAAVGRLEDLDQNPAYDDDVRDRDAAEAVLVEQVAFTPAGAAVKLRFALDMGNAPAWASRAIVAGDDTTLFARADELSSEQRAIVDALALLVRPADMAVQDAFEAWVAAQHAWNVDLRRHDTDDGDDALRLEAERLELVLADTPARTADDVLLKLLPLALNYHSVGHGPFALTLEPQGADEFPLEARAWRGVVSGMLAASPRIADLVAMRYPARATSVEVAG